MSHGFGADDRYDVYDKPLFSGSSANQTYRPKPVEGLDDDEPGAGVGGGERGTDRFKADKGFSGTEGGSAGPRSRPVEFERDRDEDPFGLNSLLGEGRRSNALDHIGQRGALGIGGGSRVGDDSSATSGKIHPDRLRHFAEATGPTGPSVPDRRDRDRDRSRSRGRGRRSRSRSRGRSSRSRSRSRERRRRY